VLSRFEGESIRIGKDVVITICKVAGGKVSVGIDAPKAVKVLRTELKEHEGKDGAN
jgi:carbon storage regulator